MKSTERLTLGGWLYFRSYRLAMRALHAFGRHWYTHVYPDGDHMLWCHWCGDRRMAG